jgi:hypothetical protein
MGLIGNSTAIFIFVDALLDPYGSTFLVPRRTFLTPKQHLTGLGRFGRNRFASSIVQAAVKTPAQRIVKRVEAALIKSGRFACLVNANRPQ